MSMLASKRPALTIRVEDDDDEARCVRELSEKTRRRLRPPATLPVALLADLLLSDAAGVGDPSALRDAGVTCVLNLAAADTPVVDYEPFGIRKVDVDAGDHSNYDILQHLPLALDLYRAAQKQGGKVVIHCVAGVNRSAAVGLALYAWLTKIPIDDAAIHLNDIRGTCLSNVAFCRQLVRWAKRNDLLDAKDDPAASYDSNESPYFGICCDTTDHNNNPAVEDDMNSPNGKPVVHTVEEKKKNTSPSFDGVYNRSPREQTRRLLGLPPGPCAVPKTPRGCVVGSRLG